VTSAQVAVLAAVPAASAAVIAAMVPRWSDARQRRRDRYAEAIKALGSWIEFPYRVARRVSDDADVLAELAERGHELQEQLAYHSAWIAADSRPLGDLYTQITTAIKAAAGPAVQSAWTRAPASEPQAMNIGTLGIDEEGVRQLLGRLHRAVRHQFGFRRLVGWSWRFALPTFRSCVKPPLER